MPLNENFYRTTIASYRGPDLIADLPDILLDLWYEDYRRTFPQS